MIKQLYLFAFTLIVGATAIAQPNTLGEFNKFIAQNWNGEYYRLGQYKVKGTPFFLGQSFEGTLVTKDGAKNKAKILYDLHNQEAGLDGGNTILQTNSGAPVEFTLMIPSDLSKETLVFKHADAFPKAGGKRYFNVLEDGAKFALLKEFKIRTVPDPSNMMDKELRLFEQYFEYYLYNKSSAELTRIKLREKDLKKAIGDDKVFKEYTTSVKTNFSKESDVADFVAAINKR